MFGINAYCQIDCVQNSLYPIDSVNKNLYPYLFDTGSSWVYEKNNAGIYDTVSLIKFEHGYTWDVKRYYEYYKLLFLNSIAKDTFNHEFFASAIRFYVNIAINRHYFIYLDFKIFNHFDS